MKRPRLRPSLALALSAFALSAHVGCASDPPPPAEPPPPAPVSEEPAPALAPAPAPAASAPAPAPAAKLAIQVFTGTPEGFLVTSTLVSGQKEALLIDAAFTLADGKKVADAVKANGKELVTVYVTHFHPDHYFGFPAVKEVFPNAKLVALPATVAGIEKTWADKVKQWRHVYKDTITSKPIVPTALTSSELVLEGEKLEIVGGVQGDDSENSYVWIPSLRAVVTGDIVYDGVFPWTAETTPETRKLWAQTLDKLLSLNATTIVPGHQKPDGKLDDAGITFTREYLTFFDETVASSKNAAEVQTKIKAKYPNAALDIILKLGAEAAFKKPKAAPAAKGATPAPATSKKAGGTP